MKYLFLYGSWYMFFFSAYAQLPQVSSSSDIYLSMKKLQVFGSVLYVAAHPDDENTRLLTYLSKERLCRTAYLSLTRGEGGQNLIGKEQGFALGLIRTQELLAARRIDGAEQFFTQQATDFGYSKTKEETLRKWDKEKVLEEMVWIIRTFQPQIMIARFPPDKRAGHGHHAASALLASEAFDAAADPGRFPDQLNKGLRPWKVRRLLWNTYNFGSGNTTSPEQLIINVGGYNKLLGKSYGEISAESRSQHKSQGFGVTRQRGEQLEYFSLVKGDSCTTDIMDNISMKPDLGKLTDRYDRLTDQLIRTYDLKMPEHSLPLLVKIYKLLLSAETSYWKDQKLKEVESLIYACSGFFCEAYANQPYAVDGDSLTVHTYLINRTDARITLRSISIPVVNIDSIYEIPLKKDRSFQQKKIIRIPLNQSEDSPGFAVNVNVQIEGLSFSVSCPVSFKSTDPVKGEIYSPLAVIPPFTIRVYPELHMCKDSTGLEGELIIAKHTMLPSEPIIPQLCWKDTCIQLDPVSFINESTASKEQKIKFSVVPPCENLDIRCAIKVNDQSYDKQLISVQYDHIPSITFFRNATIRNRLTDLKIHDRHIGYIQGAGDEIPAMLREIGYHVEELSEEACKNSVFNSYDAIVVGIRAYNTHDWLTDIHRSLINYVQQGGVLIIQYNTSTQTGPLKNGIFPYPLKITRNRVTQEDAPVSFLKKDHPVFNYPNMITAGDFDGWVQERSLYEVIPQDSSFIPLLSMHDTDEEASSGSLLVSDLGKGRIIYTTLSFFRQLPDGVAGAYRIFANLLAKPIQNKETKDLKK